MCAILDHHESPLFPSRLPSLIAPFPPSSHRVSILASTSLHPSSLSPEPHPPHLDSPQASPSAQQVLTPHEVVNSISNQHVKLGPLDPAECLASLIEWAG